MSTRDTKGIPSSWLIPTDVPEYERASGACICDLCGREYIKHPLDLGVLDHQGEPWLNVLCDGRHVKL